MLTYTPPKSLIPYFTSDKFVNLVVGPYGSTKTTASIIKLVYEAKRVAPCRDGIRRSRAVWIRNTREQLRDTSIPDFLKWLPDGQAGVFLKTESKFLLKFDDIECEVLFRGFDEANDVRRLLSLQLTFGIMDEFREINQEIFRALTGRVGRYPDKSMNGVGACTIEGVQIDKVWGATNPPDMDTEWERFLTNHPKNTEVFFQPSGLSPEADWLQYLKDGYYENLAEGKGEDWIDIYIHAKFGKSLAGKPVFRSFDFNTHVAKEALQVLNQTVVIGVDAGLTPAAVFTQQTYDGRVVVLDTIAAFDMGALRFVREKLKPLIANKYVGRQIIIIIDPAAFQRAQTDERTVADIFKAEGFSIKAASTNTISARIAAVENFLTRTVDGKSALIIDPGCTDLITALRGKYRYKINTKGEADEKPEKNDASHVCFVASTLIDVPGGHKRIDDLVPGDYVITPSGPRKVRAVTCSTPFAEVVEYEFSNGSTFRATKDHPVFVSNEQAFVPLIDIIPNIDILVSVTSSYKEVITCLHVNTTSSNTKGSNIIGNLRDITSQIIIGTVVKRCIGPFGKLNMGLFLKGSIFTILTITKTIIQSKILKWCLLVNMPSTMLINVSKTARLIGNTRLSLPVRKPRNGMPQRKVGHGIVSMVLQHGKIAQMKCAHVLTAIKNTLYSSVQQRKGTVHLHARVLPEEKAGSMMKQDRVVYAVNNSLAINIANSTHAVYLVGVSPQQQREPVFALQVEDIPMYFAEGILVKNCDAFQYSCLQHDGGQIFGGNVLGRRREVKANPTRWAV